MVWLFLTLRHVIHVGHKLRNEVILNWKSYRYNAWRQMSQQEKLGSLSLLPALHQTELETQKVPKSIERVK